MLQVSLQPRVSAQLGAGCCRSMSLSESEFFSLLSRPALSCLSQHLGALPTPQINCIRLKRSLRTKGEKRTNNIGFNFSFQTARERRLPGMCLSVLISPNETVTICSLHLDPVVSLRQR